jgi:hypothetical protein
VARAFHAALALVYLVALLSLGAQIDTLIGSGGLLPIASFVEQLGARGQVGFGQFPTLFWWANSDVVLRAGIAVGVGLSLAALAGWLPRLCFALLVPLYLSFATACTELLSFQWDNLLLECGLLAVFLPRDRPAVWIHVLLRVLLFKLYLESGVAKWQSHLGDWHDGSAMRFYYETAPLPTALAWYAHHLPTWWHVLESRATLVLELLVPFAIFGPRRVRLGALVAFTGFQLLNLSTANYGFFCWLALALHLFLLDDRDLAWLPRLPWERASEPAVRSARLRRAASAGALVASVLFLSASSIDALRTFTPWDWPRQLRPVRMLYAPYRVVNTYHLFGHITRERIEPEFQTFDGTVWAPHHMHYKAGPLDRASPFVAPHQPRVDFLLWFYGLSFRERTPHYVASLLERMCDAPAAVQELFTDPLPEHPQSVRIVFSRYQFTTPEERESSGEVWKRTWIGALNELPCG